MRVLVLLTDAYGGHGGIAKFNRDLLAALCRHPGASEVVAIPRIQLFPAEPLPDKLTYRIDALNSKLKYVRTVLQVIGTKPSFDLVVVAHLNLLPLIHIVRAQVYAPALLVLHGIEAWSPRSWPYHWGLNRIRACASVSEFTKSRFCVWSNFKSDRVFLLPESVDLERFRPGPKNAELLRRYRLAGRVILMTLGRLDSTERAKGFDEVLEVLPDLLGQFPNVSYMIAGDGTDRRRLEEKAKSLGVSERVVFTGFVPEADKVDYYRLADAYVMPSRGEGFGIVFLEALACGVPIVASKIDGSREAVHDDGRGILVDPDNPEEIKRGIMKVLKCPTGARPGGLDYYSTSNFERRLFQIISQMSKLS